MTTERVTTIEKTLSLARDKKDNMSPMDRRTDEKKCGKKGKISCGSENIEQNEIMLSADKMERVEVCI